MLDEPGVGTYDRRMRLHRPGVRTRLRGGARKLLETPHWVGLRRLGKSRSPEYRDYLAIQLKRTLSKRETDPGIGAVTLINSVTEGQPSQGPVLCVGCRNELELNRFRERGFHDVVGIDVFSDSDDILVMDMHEMSFLDDSFDVIYASHSLEHSYDVERVAERSFVSAVTAPSSGRGPGARSGERRRPDRLLGSGGAPWRRSELTIAEELARGGAAAGHPDERAGHRDRSACLSAAKGTP